MQNALMIADAVDDVADSETARYARCIKASKKVRWDIDADVIRGREFDFAQTFLSGGPVEGRRAGFPRCRRASPAVAGAGPHLRLHLRAGGALHRRQGARAVGAALARRPGRARGAGALQRRGAEAPGAVPPHRGHARGAHAPRLPQGGRPERGGARGAGREHLVGAGAHLPHRAVPENPPLLVSVRESNRRTSCGGLNRENRLIIVV